MDDVFYMDNGFPSVTVSEFRTRMYLRSSTGIH